MYVTVEELPTSTNIENYKLTNNEINSVKSKINEIEEVKSVDVYANSKIIRIIVVTCPLNTCS